MATAMVIDESGQSKYRLQSGLMFRGVPLEGRCFLSWEDFLIGPFHQVKNTLLFYNGARIQISPEGAIDLAIARVRVRVEAPSGEVLEQAIALALKHLGGEVLEMDPPLADSFVRGVRNDLRSLWRGIMQLHDDILESLENSIGKRLDRFGESVRRLIHGK